MFLYENQTVRDKVVKLAEKHDVYPDILETSGIAKFEINADNEITDVMEIIGGSKEMPNEKIRLALRYAHADLTGLLKEIAMEDIDAEERPVTQTLKDIESVLLSEFGDTI